MNPITLDREMLHELYAALAPSLAAGNERAVGFLHRLDAELGRSANDKVGAVSGERKLLP